LRAAFIGLGAIGWPMAQRVADHFALTVWNRTATKARQFATVTHCQVAATPREAAANADVVLTCLSTSKDVEAVLEGTDGLKAGLKRGALLLDCTSGDPGISRRLAADLAERGVAFADCPVSGGPDGARTGKLTVMVGADEATFKRAQPVLGAFGKLVAHVGPVGAGDTVKAVNQALLAANILTLAEALTAMVKAGVPARAGVDVLNASSGRSFVSDTLIPARVLNGAWPATFRLALLDKDIGIAVDMIRQLGLEAPVLQAARDESARARAALGEESDYLEPIRRREGMAGVEVRND
jgi:3-hydroxyisobutyrate dehydrogenase